MYFKNIKFILAVFILLKIISSCSNNTEPHKLLSVDLSRVRNIQWNLSSLETSKSDLSLSEYEPFLMVLRSNRIWASDNCNYFFGNYSVTNDSLFVTGWGTTLLGCYSTKLYFPFSHLAGKSLIMMRGEELLLIKNDSIYVYSSDFFKDIYTQDFLDDTLNLDDSNDMRISFFDSLGLFPKLVLDSKREFEIVWYNKSPEKTHFLNELSGIFGINKKNEILFTILSSAYEGNGVSIDDVFLVRGIVTSKKYEFKGKVLRIKNMELDTYYDFKN